MLKEKFAAGLLWHLQRKTPGFGVRVFYRCRWCCGGGRAPYGLLAGFLHDVAQLFNQPGGR